MMQPSSRAAALAACLGLVACQVFEPTISQRQGQVPLTEEDVPVSLAEEYPDDLAGASWVDHEPNHLAALESSYVRPHVGDDERLRLEFRDAELGLVLQTLAERARINIQLDGDLSDRVDVTFPEVTLDDALHAVLARAGRRLVEDPPGIFHVERHDGGEAATASFALQSVQAAEIEPALRALAGPSTTLVLEPQQNLVMARGSRADVEAVATFLDGVDRLKRQVLIEVRILEVSLGDTFDLGVSGALDGSLDGNTLALLQDLSTNEDSFQFTFENASGSVEATINALSRFVGTDLVSSPRVLALSGSQASIEVVREVPYVNVTSTTSGTTGGVGTQTLEEVQFKEAGVKLRVTPTIQAGGVIQITIVQEFSEVIDSFNDIPVLDTRKLETGFLVRDRETVVLGGLMQDRRLEIDAGVPILMDIPLLGRLFRSDEDTGLKRELVIFLTPRIVDPDEAARLVRVLRRSYVERARDTGVRTKYEER